MLLKAVRLDDITSRVNTDGEEHRYKLGSMMLQQREEEDPAEETEKQPKKWDRNQACMGVGKLSEKVCQGGGSVQQHRILLMGQIIQWLRINLRFSNAVVIVDKSSFGSDVKQSVVGERMKREEFKTEYK